MLRQLYRSSLALVADLYELTMACGYWRAGLVDHQATFHLFFRTPPFGGGFTIAAGLDYAIEWLEELRFAEEDVAYLARLSGSDGQPLFPPEFLEVLKRFELVCDVDAIPEGTVVFAHEPLLRVTGPLWQAQLLETALLNILNFQTLVATKAARVKLAASGAPILEFGLRRAQGLDGGVAASRAAFIGGASATSNLLAGQLLGIPVRGTHAHSWVMAFASENEAFAAWAAAMPNNAVFLVDTYDSMSGVEEAITAGRALRAQGFDLTGIRLDSGDLAYLSQQARGRLDDAGFAATKIVASNDLDEHLIESLRAQGAAIDIWGVGTRLVTAYDQPALGGVYKLAAIRAPGGPWEPRLKLSEQSAKISTPGRLAVRRFRGASEFIGDAIYDLDLGIPNDCVIVDPLDLTRRKHLAADLACGDLLEPVLRQGKVVAPRPSLVELQQRTQQQLASFHAGVKRFVHPHEYPVGLEQQLFERKTALVLAARGE